MLLGVISRVSSDFGVIFGEKLQERKTIKICAKWAPTPQCREPTPHRRPKPQCGMPRRGKAEVPKKGSPRVLHDVTLLRRNGGLRHSVAA